MELMQEQQKKKHPLEIKSTDEKGKVIFYMYIDGEVKDIRQLIVWLNNYIKIREMKTSKSSL